jgi:hypothetical protein
MSAYRHRETAPVQMGRRCAGHTRDDRCNSLGIFAIKFVNVVYVAVENSDEEGMGDAGR